ncbi:hypothetical protein ACI1US_01113 [Leucobacter sp. BZR 635]
MNVTHTLRTHLDNNRASVSVAAYEASRTLPSRQGASWGIWGERTGDLSVFSDSAEAAPRLRRDVVLIGANFGLGGDVGEFKAFQNFHASSSGGDTKLRRGLTGTVLEGAFLTDIVKDYPTKYANKLAAEIKAGHLDTTKHVAEGFAAEQEALSLGPDTLYIPMGVRTRELWDLLVARGVLPANQRVFHREYGNGPLFKGKPVRNLTHYAAAVNMVDAVAALLDQESLH